MSIIKLLDLLGTDEISRQEADVLGSRREAFKKMSSFSKKLSLAALPTAVLGSLPNIAFAQDATSVVGVLNFALTLEHLEYRFYQTAVDNRVVPAADLAVFNQILQHEKAHVAFLQETINGLEGDPVEEPEFDFTAGGTFDNPHDPANYAVFMALAQGFEDTGVRAYKGQAGALQAAKDGNMNVALTAALSIHGVEARHASQVRRMREQKGWIVQDQAVSGVEEATAPIYAGEDNVVQGGVDVTTLTPDIDGDAVTAAYDEPLTMDDVLAIASLFIVS